MTLELDKEKLDQQISGQVIAPDDERFDEVRSVYNAMIDKRPALIAQCSTNEDVKTALEEGSRAGLPIAIRGGGHNGAGFGTVDDGLVIDLSPMNQIDVDSEARTALVQGGATWGEVDAATHEHGLATVSGIIASTGVGGLTLGGGHGHLSRKYGLTIDNLLEAEVVLADGRVLKASETENEDLFWALRGGGGNFGIVTSFKYRLHPVKNITWGPTAWPVEATNDVLSWFRDYMPNEKNRDIYGYFALLTVPPDPSFPEQFHMHKACAIVWAYLGDPGDAAEALSPVQDLEPAFDGVQEVPYPAAQGAFDALYPKGLQWYWRGDFFKEVPDEAVAEYARFGETLPTLHSGMHLYPIDGAVQDIAPTETAFAHRDVNWSQATIGVDPDPANAGLVKEWVVDFWEALHPYSAGAAYVNFMMDEGQERVRSTYKQNYDRLAEIKAKYDPDNVFRVNQNIQPAG